MNNKNNPAKFYIGSVPIDKVATGIVKLSLKDFLEVYLKDGEDKFEEKLDLIRGEWHKLASVPELYVRVAVIIETHEEDP